MKLKIIFNSNSILTLPGRRQRPKSHPIVTYEHRGNPDGASSQNGPEKAWHLVTWGPRTRSPPRTNLAPRSSKEGTIAGIIRSKSPFSVPISEPMLPQSRNLPQGASGVRCRKRNKRWQQRPDDIRWGGGRAHRNSDNEAPARPGRLDRPSCPDSRIRLPKFVYPARPLTSQHLTDAGSNLFCLWPG